MAIEGTEGTMRADETGPGYYRAAGIQAWDLWAAWGLDPYLANAVKYIVRAGRKGEDAASEGKDLRKAIHYLRKRMELRLVVAPRWGDAAAVSAVDAFRAFGLSSNRVHALSLIKLSAECGHRLVVEQLAAAVGALEAELGALGEGGRSGQGGQGGQGEHPQTSLGVAQSGQLQRMMATEGTEGTKGKSRKGGGR